MELILKSDNKDKLAKVLALAKKLGISVEQKEGTVPVGKGIPPKGKAISVTELLEDFGKGTDFPSTEEIRSKAWPTLW